MNLKEEYIKFFEENGHKQIPSAPIVPKDDPTVLFNTAGMQPLVPYLLGKPHPYGKRLCDYQKCVRLTDLEEIGDKTHHTFFEMLGNWSLGDYFKKESIKYSFDFLTKVLHIPVERLAITVFEGDDKIPRDEVSAARWRDMGISDKRIAYLGRDDNFWIAGETGPCGGDTEIFYFRSEDDIPEKFDPDDDRWVEIWNNVFMEFYQDEDGNITELKQKNVDTGMGLERVVAVLEGVDDNYKSSVWRDVISLLEDITSLPYDGNEKAMRVVADHIRTATFIAADPAGIKPSNNGQGYILRRLIRRAIRYARSLNIDINSNWDERIALLIISKYEKYYVELSENKDVVLEVLKNEKMKFARTLEKGLREFDRLVRNDKKEVNKDIAFKLYDTYGFPIEQTIEEARERGMSVDEEGFKEKFREHQEKSKSASRGKFKGGLAGTSEMEVKYHTATHLLNAALKIVLHSNDSHQMGSNITPERMRFDFTCDHKLSKEEIQEAEDIVNKWIQADYPVYRKEMTKAEALASGAECRFIERYPENVTVYEIGDVSKELCGGPHVKHTNVLGHFKIVKEEACSAGVRRIKAILED
ncbi:MAG TPA: alanine--tRNA ligase [Candidatus Coprosoma intestinipullorum]|uniref:Alanine--tRNA ligase n=1 Tax=Candidatus Coprosoma intestinipullorum TaxID=2840752 RepID=A0A9D1CYX3_9FIRM|nr:alanine--tRNA ligase [Candidatus Coprosoma intestinipullorum]